MIILNEAALLGLAAFISSLASLIWALRRKR
jgi:hypothetical protein